MTSVFTARRRAEEFHSLVEGASTGRTPDARYADVIRLVEELRSLPAPEPRPEFTAELREQLMAAADTLLAPSEDTRRLTLPPRRTARDRRVAAAVGAVAIVGASTSLAVAAQTALPGEMLYPLKRALENAEAEIRVGPEAKGAVLLAAATDRLDEIKALSRNGALDEGPVMAETLLTFADQATEASDLLLDDYAETGNEASIRSLNDFTASSMESLAELQGQLPEEARDALRHAVQVLTDIDAAAERACPSCPGGIDEIPSVLLSAGEVAEPGAVVLPGTFVANSTTRGGKHDGRRGTGGDKQDGGGVDQPISDPDVLDPTGNESGTGDSDTSDPLEPVTGGLTGGGKQTSGGGLTGVPQVDDPVKDLTEDLEDVGDDLTDLP